MYLDVQPSGSRSWVQRITIRGRRRELGLGGFPLVSLKEARALAFANRKLARTGGDPLAEKRRLKRTPTFAAAAEQVWTQMQPGWRNPKYGKDWMSSMTRFAFPLIGKLPVSEVTSADVIETLRPVWHVRPATARRVRERISTVMEWAVAMDLRADNPCDLSGIHVSHSYLYIYTWLSDHDSLVVPLFLNGNPRDHPSRPRTGLSQIS